MTELILQGSTLTSLDDAYDKLAKGLDLPDWFGRNLDALYDSLTGDVEGPLSITVIDAAAAAQRLGPRFEKFLETLAEAGQNRPDLTVTLK